VNPNTHAPPGRSHQLPIRARRAVLCLALLLSAAANAGGLPRATLLADHPAHQPADNAAFLPPPGALAAPAFAGVVHVQQSRMLTLPAIDHPLQQGRDARLFPAVDLEFFSLGNRLVPVQRGEMVREAGHPAGASFWRVIPESGRIWREAGDAGWSRAAFPLTLVNDTENHAQQGLATFLYRAGRISRVTFQFVQQSAPYLLGRHFVAWGSAAAESTRGDAARLPAWRAQAQLESDRRLPSAPWSALQRQAPPGTLDGFGGPLDRKWLVAAALVRNGTLYYKPAATAYGEYPYPLEMRFGVRSVMKSVGAPLALLHLAQVYGPWVLNLHIGEYVAGLDAKWQRIRFVDAANMASGFGGTGSFNTHPNDMLDGYLGGDYDGWYTAPSQADKLARINANWRPYPWEPGTVVRYRDQDFYLLGAALDAFLKSMRGASADVWDMLREEVFKPIGIFHAPAVRTREPNGSDGLVWFNAGYYPNLDDLAKIALLYQSRGRAHGHQLLNEHLTQDLLAARGALQKDGDAALAQIHPEDAADGVEFYEMGFHFVPYAGSASHKRVYLPSMSGFGENEVILYPNGMVSIIMGNAATFKPGEQIKSAQGPLTLRAVDRLDPF
jgi:hypothetical protein